MYCNINSNHLFAHGSDVISEIASLSKYSSFDIFNKFVNIFYWYSTKKDLSSSDIQTHVNMAEKAYDFIQDFKGSEYKIDLYSYKDSKEEFETSVLQILVKDKPFVIDSVVCYLEKRGVRILKMFHHVFGADRDSSGKLVKLIEDKSDEGIVVFNIAKLKLDDVEKVIKDIADILDQVCLAVNDWPYMIEGAKDYNLYLTKTHKNNQDIPELIEFIDGILGKYFVHLGAVEYAIEQKNNEYVGQVIEDSVQGIAKNNQYLVDLIKDTSISIAKISSDKKMVEIGRIDYDSKVHRDTKINIIALNYFDDNGKLIKTRVLIGLFTSILYYQSATLIPLIRGKMSYILNKAGFKNSSHNGKEIISILECLPRDELFQIEQDDLYQIVMEAYALMLRPEVKIFIRESSDKKFANCILFMPNDRAGASIRENVVAVLRQYLGNVISINFANILHSKIYYYHIIIDLHPDKKEKIDCEFLERHIDKATVLWHKKLREILFKNYSRIEAYEIYQKYKSAFPEGYKEKHLPSQEVIDDIKYLNHAFTEKKVIFKLNHLSCGEYKSVELKIYADHEILLSEVIPMLQNIGFAAIAEYIYKISSKFGNVWVHHFYLASSHLSSIENDNEIINIESALSEIWEEKVTNDSYNKMILSSKLSSREVSLLRAIGKYLYQIKFGYSREFIGTALNNHPALTLLLIELFKTKFDFEGFSKDFDVKKRKEVVADIIAKKQHLLKNVNDPAEDRVFTKFFEVIENIVRTNYYVKDNNGNYKEYISFKVKSSMISDLPKPIPFMEVFVSSCKFEAIHLRSTKVSRGGLRWSDRPEDFRTEVLGLVRAQIPKNSIIVPGGSKGGFVVKRKENMSNQDYYNLGVECYKNFLRGLLDITDNIIDGEIIHPKDMIIYDEKDPYLVVAADKGTATFSDTANSISAEYNFWLGDAFASGGSVGYDHKKMGITAKGAWVSVMCHFKELGIDTQTTDFTVVGIGDMSGDVFGNGMLLSKHIRLLAAFNHMHIFIDPNPDSAKSFVERSRLFNLPSSTWNDYDKSVISKGGMIFERKSKLLNLTPEIMELFDIKEAEITPEDLIQKILRSKFDLLWNGGIGTYVKASHEDNLSVGDKSNDALRINGSELGARVVGEGGNLGFTQSGRIEYASLGGKINTDAIDNSAGVDCSDHEVNIKIALEMSVRSGDITYDERNILLEKMTDEVAELVLRDNIMQTMNLSITSNRKSSLLGSQDRLIDILENEGRITRIFDKLPSKKEFQARIVNGQALSRPELSVILAYSKLSIYDNLLSSTIVDDAYFEKNLLEYFPKMMREKFKEQILNHPLRKEIIATILTNDIVNRLDSSFVHITALDYDLKYCDVVRAYVITKEVFNLEKIWAELEINKNHYDNATILDIYEIINRLLSVGIKWILRNSANKINIIDIEKKYKHDVSSLFSSVKLHLQGVAKEKYDNTKKLYEEKGVSNEDAELVASMLPLCSAYEIVYIAKKHSVSLDIVTKLYFSLGEKFSLDWFRESVMSIIPENNWQRLSILALKEELFDMQRDLTISALEYMKGSEDINSWLDYHSKHFARYEGLILELKLYEKLDYSMIDIALKKLKIFLV